MDSSDKRVKIVGVTVAAVLLAVVGVIALNSANEAPMAPLDHAQALASAKNSKTPMSQLPEEWQVVTPKGWEVDSDEPVPGAPEEEESADDLALTEESEAMDNDIDFPLLMEEGDDGEKVVTNMDMDVISDDEGGDDDEEEVDDLGLVEVGEDKKKGKKGKKALKCKHRRLKKCRFHKLCNKKCNRKCKRVTRRVCKNRKFCRCFCKYKGNKKAAVKCVTYKRKKCKPVANFLCKNSCKKFCRRVRRCYCCKGPKQVRQQCRRTCRHVLQKTKCGRCRCRKLVCYKDCIMICRR